MEKCIFDRMMVVPPETARLLAQTWLDAWNERDFEALDALYGEEILYLSPLANEVIEGKKDGLVSGKRKIQDYFERCHARWPDDRFELLGVYAGVESLTVVYISFGGRQLCEVMILNPRLKIKKVYCNYLLP